MTFYPNSAASNVPRGLRQDSVGTITAGAGGTNGTFPVAWSGGNFSINPTATFIVAGGAVTAVNITDPGLYIGPSPSVPTPSFAASAGLTGADVTLTAQFLVQSGGSYWVLSSDGSEYDCYNNVAGTPAINANFPPIPSSVALTALGQVLPVLPAPADIFADFTQQKYYNAGDASLLFSEWLASVSGTFARAGTNNPYFNASGYLVQGTANQPRFSYDPATGIPALLYEAAATNLIPYSQEVGYGAWAFANSANVTRTTNGAIGIDGGMTGGLVRETATTALHQFYYWSSLSPITTGSFYAFQFIFRPEGRTKLKLTPSPITFGIGGVILIDVVLMTVTGAGAAGWHLEAWPNGAFRLWKSFTGVTVGSGFFSMVYTFLDDSGADTYLGDITKGIVLLGAQLELVASAGDPPSTYIHRPNATVQTRDADAMQITLPPAVNKITYTFGNGAQQIVDVSPGYYSVPTTLNQTDIASLITVDLAVVGSPVTSVAGRTGAVTLSQNDISGLKTTDSPTYVGMTITGPLIAVGGSLLRVDSAIFQWTTTTPQVPNTLRSILIGGGTAKSCTFTLANFTNNVLLGTDAVGAATSIKTAVVIGDSAGGNSPSITNSNLIGNEAGSGPSIITSNVIGNLSRCGYLGATVTRSDVMGFSAMYNNGCVDTVAIGSSVGIGVAGSVGSINQSVLMGSSAGSTLAGVGNRTNLILIGYNVQPPSATTSNYFSFGNFFKGDLSTAEYKLQKQDGSDALLTVAQLNLSNLPTSDPGVPGAIWRSGTDLKISI